MSSVEILKVHFIVGKYLHLGRSYVTSLINDLVRGSKIHKPAYVHLTVHTDINRHYEEFGYLSVLDTIHRIDLEIEKYSSIFVCTAPNRIEIRRTFVHNYISTEARMHIPCSVSVDTGPELLFIPKKTAPVLPMDLFVSRKKITI
jgi:hypothetical protein